jgi:hypothetical protein
MPKKKKPTKTEKQETRLRKARQWVLTYEGSHIVRAYRKRFGVDVICAIADMETIGALSPDKLAAMKRGEEIRLQKKREERAEKLQCEFAERWSDSNDTFFYIAGYTSGGAPYGVTWEEMGLTPYEQPE